MNMSRLISLFFQGSLVKRIAAGLVLGILVALITPMLQPTLGFNLAEKVGVLGQIFVRSLRAVAPLLIFVLVMAAIANKKVGSKTSMKSIIVLYLVGTFLAALVLVPNRSGIISERRYFRCTQRCWNRIVRFNFQYGR